MSTLIKYVIAIVLHFVQAGEPLEDHSAHEAKTVQSKYSVQELNPHYIITRDEFLSYKNECAI
jgi:transposase